jgi:hypothetical protein
LWYPSHIPKTPIPPSITTSSGPGTASHTRHTTDDSSRYNASSALHLAIIKPDTGILPSVCFALGQDCPDPKVHQCMNCKAPYSADSTACPERERMQDVLRSKGPAGERYDIPELYKLTIGQTQDMGISQTRKTIGNILGGIIFPNGTISITTNGQQTSHAPPIGENTPVIPRPYYQTRETTPPIFLPRNFNIARDPDTNGSQETRQGGSDKARQGGSDKASQANHYRATTNQTTKLPPRARGPLESIQSKPGEAVLAQRTSSTIPSSGELDRVSALKNRPKTPLAELTTDLDIELTEMRARIKELEARKRNAIRAV